MRSEPGTYVLLLHSHRKATVQVGKWGELGLQPGIYLYVGSAFGAGGVRARVGRHLRRDKKVHWHLDYLRPLVEPQGVWVSYAPIQLEHRWATALAEWPELTPIPGFGCSDCRCGAHLFATAVPPQVEALARLDPSTEYIPFDLQAA